MAAALGVNANRIFTSVLRSAPAGRSWRVLFAPSAAPISAPTWTWSSKRSRSSCRRLGQYLGSALAALLIGMLKAFGILVMPQFALAFVFALMVLVLILRPRGLFGARE